MSDSAWMPPDPNRPAADPPAPEPHVTSDAAPVAPESFAAPPAAAPPSSPFEPSSIIEPTPSATPRRGRSKVVVAGAVAAVLAVGAAGTFAVAQMTGASAGGAASPSELGQEVMAAIENEDVLGLIDTLAPGEREALGDPLVELVSELTRLEVLSPEADLAKIAGLDIQLDGESVRTESTNVADIVNLRLTADATVSVDGAAVPIGDLLIDSLDPADVDEVRNTQETETELFELPLTAIELDGSWYVSLFHLAAEQERADMTPTPDIPVTGVGASGAESPEAALDQLLDSLEQLDLTAIIRSLNPGEAAALQRYAPLFLDEAQAELDEVPIDLTITDRRYELSGDGDRRTAQVVGMTVTGSVGDVMGLSDESESFTVTLDAGCVHAEFADDTFDQCIDDVGASTLDEYIGEVDDAPALVAFVEALQEALSDMQTPGIELRQFDGDWYVSPIATYTEVVLKLLRALDRQELDTLIERGQAAADEFFDGLFGGSSDDDFTFDDFSSDEFTGDEFTSDEFTFDDLSSDGDSTAAASELDIDESSSIEASPLEACYSEADPAAAAACFEAAVAADPNLGEWAIPIELRFLECGYAEVRWGSGVYELSDAEFMAAADAARPCFLALVDAGEIETFDLPNEIAHPECFEGRNWYNVFDDPDYDDRYWACIEAAWAASTGA